MIEKEQDESLHSENLAKIREGTPSDDLIVPEGFQARLEKKQGLRNVALEVFADSVFYKAADCLVELLDDPEPEIRVKAASKLLDLRKEVYKVQSTKKIVEPIMTKLFDDGFDF